jgi:translation initiation factor 1 (eIF-1/SUI1)
MKAKLGTGGTIKIRNIEIQGDKLEAVKNFLIEDGFTVKG